MECVYKGSNQKEAIYSVQQLRLRRVCNTNDEAAYCTEPSVAGLLIMGIAQEVMMPYQAAGVTQGYKISGFKSAESSVTFNLAYPLLLFCSHNDFFSQLRTCTIRRFGSHDDSSVAHSNGCWCSCYCLIN